MIPLPAPAETNLHPPEQPEVNLLAQGFMGAAAPQAGLTDLQRLVLIAMCRSMTGFSVDPARLTPLPPEELAAGLATRNVEFRTRIVQILLLGELVLRPIPGDVADRVSRVAELLGVDDGMLRVAREYSQGSLSLALIRAQRLHRPLGRHARPSIAHAGRTR